MEVGTGNSTVTIEPNLASRVTFLLAGLLTNEVCEQGTEFRIRCDLLVLAAHVDLPQSNQYGTRVSCSVRPSDPTFIMHPLIGSL
jgi:hypothetical protein